MSDGNMESSGAPNNSHLPKLMWRPEVSLLACKIFRALDIVSLGPAKAPSSTVQQHFFALGVSRDFKNGAVQNEGKKKWA